MTIGKGYNTEQIAKLPLEIIENTFNVKSGTLDIKNARKILKYWNRQANIQYNNEKLERMHIIGNSLYVEADKNPILFDYDSYEKIFDKIGNFGFDNIKEVYTVCNKVIFDIHNARNWLKMYEDWLKELENLEKSDKIDMHEQLVKLGLAILGRAIELTPIKTGLLRKSAVLIDNGESVTIAYSAPYASYVHENMNNEHNIGHAKFLEMAVQEFFPNKTIWVDSTGFNGVQVEISLNPEKVVYKHYG